MSFDFFLAIVFGGFALFVAVVVALTWFGNDRDEQEDWQ